ncbi:hypothetical protein BKA65DRAFT_474548 [Rhexocercosporidium sp. MPI-PUGE-AT-0058]|nr:hypothetical protein BKA65DRAFT_474548 [Rhexocercosporidium sp. MPI-PUGE-AT-0058]
MDHQVQVTLRALNGDLSIAERNLTLNNKDKAIPVGRASKSVTKGILGAADNAWFDSPVMSRNHATIELNSEDMTVTIQDIGSMHGTWLNDFELPKNTPTIITDGDVVVFGAEVRRGAEVFPACSFQVNYKSVPYQSANTFAFPESSDVEEEEDGNYDDFSEDEIEVEEREQLYSSEDGVSIESASRKVSSAPVAIDLTGDDYIRHSIPNQVDLTGETEAEKQMMKVMSGRPDDIDEHADQNSIAMYAGNNPIVLDSEDEGEDEDADFSSDLDDQSEDDASRDSDRARIHAVFENDSEGIADSDNEGSIDDSAVESEAGMEVDEEEFNAPEPSTINNLTRYAVATDENSVIRLSDVRTRFELPDSDEEDGEDDQSDLGLSEAGAEGMKALYGASSSLPAPYWEDENGTGNQDQADQSSPQPFFTSTQDLGLSASAVPTNINERRTEVPQQTLLRPFSIIRQPSPSDAAMVKSAALPRNVSICDMGESSEYSPQALGEKSGKPAFFAAREVNKAKFGSGEQERALGSFQASNRTANAFVAPSKSRKGGEMSTHAMSNTTTGHSSTWDEPAVEQSPFAPAKSSFGIFDAEPLKPTFIGSGNASKFFKGNMTGAGLREAVSSIPTRDYCSFLDKPDQSPIMERAPSPLPDMTSSFSYNASKDNMIPASVQQHSARSAIKITDIVESSSPFNRTNSLKRKSENISTVADKELRNWANSNVESELSEAAVSAPGHGEKSNDISNVGEAPAAKRFKKLFANAGYVALGAATVFATLVATAPDLM